jgi:hypothetical protein
MEKLNEDRVSKYINFDALLREDYAEATTPPAFDANIASNKDKERQWTYYFVKHQEEVRELLKGEEQVLCVSITWLRDIMPSFAKCFESDDFTTGSYIKFGNRALRSLYVDGYESHENEYIRFTDKNLDALAEEAYAEEIQVREKYGADAPQKAQKLILDPAFFYKLGKDLEQGFFLPGVNRIRYILGEESLKRQIAIHMVASRWGHDTINILSGGFATVKDTMVKMIFGLTGTQYMQRGYLTAAGMRYSKTMQDANVLYLPEADISVVSGGWVFNTDDSRNLTDKVINAKLDGFRKPREVLSEEDLKVWHYTFDILTNEADIPQNVLIPFAPNLKRMFNATQSQARRSPEKLCELIQDVATLRRYQKPEEKRDRADVIDLFLALRIGVTAISETIGESSSKEAEIFTIVEMLDEYKEGVSAKEIAIKAPYASNTCYVLAEALTTKNYLAKGKRGRENVYSIKNELDKGSNLCLTHLQNLDKPIVVLKECLCLVYPFLNSFNSDEL